MSHACQREVLRKGERLRPVAEPDGQAAEVGDGMQHMVVQAKSPTVT